MPFSSSILHNRTRLLNIRVHPCQSVGQFSFQWERAAKSFERKHAGQTGDRFGRSVGFGGKQILEVLVLGRHKRFGPDDAGIREIPGAIAKTLDAVQVELPGPFLL